MLSIAQHLFAFRKPKVDDRLRRLFSSRAELKREYTRLQRESDRLREQVRYQENETLRAQQRLDHLEGLLADPERAANVALYFQLRSIWAYGKRRLLRVGRDLTARQAEHECQREAARFEEHRQAALSSMEMRLSPLVMRSRELEQALVATRARRFEAQGFWRYFRRRRLDRERAALEAELSSIEVQRERYEKARHDKLKEHPTAPEDIGVEGRRRVNLSVIALAQELLLHFADQNVAAHARDAHLRKVTDVHYGGLNTCRNFSQQIEIVLQRIEAQDDLPARVRRRAQLLRSEVRYRNDTDAVPLYETLARIPVKLTADELPRALGGQSIDVNVLADDYWSLGSALLP